MAFQVPTENYSGQIAEVTIGVEPNLIKIGGEKALPFYSFEGEIPNKPLVAMEVYDNNPQDWPEESKEPFKEVLDDPVKWSQKCVSDYQADLICLKLISTDPNGEDRSPDEAAEVVKAVIEKVDAPLIVYGTQNVEKDKAVLEKAANAAEGHNIAIGPAQEENYKTITAAAMAAGHNIIAFSPCDLNMAKQLNILISQMGFPKERIIIDPSAAGLGYGLDYVYSIIERLKLAALTQGDEMTRMPVISNLASESWKLKESKVSIEDEPDWGDQKTRAISWEVLTATSFLLAGSDLVVLRHPESVSKVKKYIDVMLD